MADDSIHIDDDHLHPDIGLPVDHLLVENTRHHRDFMSARRHDHRRLVTELRRPDPLPDHPGDRGRYNTAAHPDDSVDRFPLPQTGVCDGAARCRHECRTRFRPLHFRHHHRLSRLAVAPLGTAAVHPDYIHPGDILHEKRARTAADEARHPFRDAVCGRILFIHIRAQQYQRIRVPRSDILYPIGYRHTGCTVLHTPAVQYCDAGAEPGAVPKQDLRPRNHTHIHQHDAAAFDRDDPADVRAECARDKRLPVGLPARAGDDHPLHHHVHFRQSV